MATTSFRCNVGASCLMEVERACIACGAARVPILMSSHAAKGLGFRVCSSS